MYLKWLCIWLGLVLQVAGMDPDQEYFDRMLNEPEDRSHWVDPFDMEFVDDVKPNSCDKHCKSCQDELAVASQQLIQCRQEYKTLQESLDKLSNHNADNNSTKENKPVEPPRKKKPEKVCEELYFRRHVTVLMDKLGLTGSPEATHLKVEISLTRMEVHTLQKFRENKFGDIYEVDHIVANMIKSRDNFVPPVYEFWETAKSMSRELRDPLIAAGLVICLAYVLVFTFRYFSLRKILVVFCIGCVTWHWLHMYKKAWADKKSKLMKNFPKECRPDEMTWGQTIASTWTGFFNKDDHCKKYHEALLVDPIYEVNPMMAMAELSTGLVFTPLRLIGKEFGEMFNGLLSVIPIAYQPLVIIIFVVLIIFCLILVAGYKIHLPFFFELSPANVNPSGLHKEVMEMKMLLIEQEKRRGIMNEDRHYLHIKSNRGGFDALDGEAEETSGVQTIQYRRFVSESAKDSPYLAQKQDEVSTPSKKKLQRQVTYVVSKGGEPKQDVTDQTCITGIHQRVECKTSEETGSENVCSTETKIERICSLETKLEDVLETTEASVLDPVDVDTEMSVRVPNDETEMSVRVPTDEDDGESTGSERVETPPPSIAQLDSLIGSPRSQQFMSKVVEVLESDD